MSDIVNHDEAIHLAHMKYHESNLARCYLDLVNRNNNNRGGRSMLIYIASPYTIGDPVTNVNRQIDAAEALAQRGHVPIVPLLSHYWHQKYQHDWQFWLNLCKRIVPTADAVLRLDGESQGADVEVALAQDIGLPVYYKVEDVPVVGNEGVE